MTLYHRLTERMERQSMAPKVNRMNRRRQSGFLWRSLYQCRAMPIIDNEKVRNTLIEYITTRAETLPPVAHSAAKAAAPMSMIPFRAASRSDKLPNQCGT